jgi:hypothetical protein
MDAQMASMRQEHETAVVRRNETLVLLSEAREEFPASFHEISSLRSSTEQSQKQREELLEELGKWSSRKRMCATTPNASKACAKTLPAPSHRVGRCYVYPTR